MWLNEKLLRVAVTSIILVSASLVSAANLFGTVGFQGEPKSNVTVELWRNDIKTEHKDKTDQRGYYLIRQVPPARYEVRVRSDNGIVLGTKKVRVFDPQTENNINIK